MATLNSPSSKLQDIAEKGQSSSAESMAASQASSSRQATQNALPDQHLDVEYCLHDSSLILLIICKSSRVLHLRRPVVIGSLSQPHCLSWFYMSGARRKATQEGHEDRATLLQTCF